MDVERRADRTHPAIARMHPERPLRIVSHVEIRLALPEMNDTTARAVVDLDPAVGVEIERGAVRQRYRHLLADGRLEATVLVLLVERCQPKPRTIAQPLRPKRPAEPARRRVPAEPTRR